jgi:carbon monoxide dehydrogenase subunit G
MATLRETLQLRAPASAVWDAVRDVSQVHRRLVPGFVTEARMEDGARVLTFANGTTAREEIVNVDDDARRLVYAIPRGRFLHYQGTVDVSEDGAGSLLVWTIDLLPDEYAESIGAMMRQGADVMRATLNGARS